MGQAETFAAERLQGFIERVERLEEERACLAGDMREVYSEAKGSGFDTKAIRQIIRLRKQEPAEREEQREILDIYLEALGMEGGSRGNQFYAEGVEQAADLFNDGLTVSQVATRLGVSRAEAGKLRQRGDRAGLITAPRGKAGRPKIVSSEKNLETISAAAPQNDQAVETAGQRIVSGISDAETVSGAGEIVSEKENLETISGAATDPADAVEEPKRKTVSKISDVDTVAVQAASRESGNAAPAVADQSVSRGTKEELDGLDLPTFLQRAPDGVHL